MSVAKTKEQVHNRSKTVTRRLGWEYLEPGDRLTLCEKVQGRRKGEPLVRIAEVEVVSVRRERLDAITADDVAREGFPDWTPLAFVNFFTAEMKVAPDVEVTRIEFSYLEGVPS